MSTYTMTDAARRTAELVNEARYGREPVLITDHGKPAAVVISPEMMARYQALEDAADLAEIEVIKARGPVFVSNEDAQQLMNQWLDEAEAADQKK
jgi:prevent-host-death family protein